jgi:ATP-dependent Clp protease ATP-binding subunit ClpC
MFERFTDRARNVVVLAQDEARLLNHNYIGTEHILLGLIHEGEGVAAQALDLLGISLAAVRQQVEEIIGRGQQAPSGHIPFTPRAKKVLELSLREALQLGHNYIGTEHILLGLIREGKGVAAQVLVKLGGNLDRVRQQVIALEQENPTTEELPPAARRRTVRTHTSGAAEAFAHAERESAVLAAKLEEILSRLDSISGRLAAIEQALNLSAAADDD